MPACLSFAAGARQFHSCSLELYTGLVFPSVKFERSVELNSHSVSLRYKLSLRYDPIYCTVRIQGQGWIHIPGFLAVRSPQIGE
jgi:hypothetical protein